MHVSEYLKTRNLQITVDLRGIQFVQDKAIYKYGHFTKLLFSDGCMSLINNNKDAV